MDKRKVLDILSWIFLGIAIIFLLWRIFGNSPSELLIIVPILFTILMKISSISENIWSIKSELKEHKTNYKAFKENVKGSFENMRKDIKK